MVGMFGINTWGLVLWQFDDGEIYLLRGCQTPNHFKEFDFLTQLA